MTDKEGENDSEEKTSDKYNMSPPPATEGDDFNQMSDVQTPPADSAKNSKQLSGNNEATTPSRELTAEDEQNEFQESLSSEIADRGDPFENDDRLFSEVNIGTEDPDKIWEQLTHEQVPKPTNETPDKETTVIVPISSFCEQCPHVSDPPNVECEQGTAQIIKFVNPSEVKLANCPVVERKEAKGLIDSDKIRHVENEPDFSPD